VRVGALGKNAARKAAEKNQAKLVLGDLTSWSPSPWRNLTPSLWTWRPTGELVAGSDLKRGTRIQYGNAITHRLSPTVAALPITDVTSDRVEAWWVRLLQDG